MTTTEATTTLQKLPVTLLTGVSDESKSLICKKVAENKDGMKIVLFVNDLQKFKFDASQIEKQEEDRIALKNGSLLVQASELYLEQLSSFVVDKKFDNCLFEVDKLEPLVATIQAFAAIISEEEEHEHDENCDHEEEEDGIRMNDMAPLDTIVAVVDGETFMKDLESEETFADRYGEDSIPQDASNEQICFQLVEQIEDANIVIIHNLDKAEDKKTVEALIRKLNPVAKIMIGDVNPKELFNTGLYSLENSENDTPVWMKQLDGTVKSDTIDGISSFAYKRRRPFNTEKLNNLVYGSDYLNKETGIIRSKGIFWLCTRNNETGDWNHVKNIIEFTSGGPFVSSLSEEELAAYPPEAIEKLKSKVEGEHGDRRTEILFIGKSMNQKEIEEKLDSCLITPEELAKGVEYYGTMCEDSLPEWPVDDLLAMEEMFGVEDDEDEEGDEEDAEGGIDITTTPKRKRNTDESGSSKKTKK
ncbi:hypothetical protein C9374_010753 [Naegleria lovaniensis]|uniref:CobW C-terminal domain-containing protein n=1 Tax=Naegleria lovaniensis TaxID=51637 RepID=A0AA88GFP8_NAELO|nr:uncharacterized protein C9374_010753 [Naegleria lovaniensis]KAG2374469.1 hypothetical protein C9374_010753 [Naegleria lovaniensis]